MGNNYIVSYSRVQRKFMLIKADTRHIVKVCDMFQGIFEKIKVLRSVGHINLVFSDSAIDELQVRGFEREEIAYL